MVDGHGRIFFSDVVKNEVYRLDRDGRLHTVKSGVHSHLLREYGAKYFGEHLWYEPAKDKFSSFPFEMDPAGGFRQLENAPLCALSPCDAQGRRYVSRWEGIERIGRDGSVEVLGGVPFAGEPGGRYERLMGTALDARGNLFVAHIEYHVVRQITPEGRLQTVRESGLNWSPWGVATGADGLYVLEYRTIPAGSRIVRIGVDGRTAQVCRRR